MYPAVPFAESVAPFQGIHVLSFLNALAGRGTQAVFVEPLTFLNTNINGLSVAANEPVVTIFGT